MSNWNSLSDTEKIERLGNLEIGKEYSFKIKRPYDMFYHGKYLGRWNRMGKDLIKIKNPNEFKAQIFPDAAKKGIPLEDLDIDMRPFVQPEEVRRREEEQKKAKEAKEEARKKADMRALKAARPGVSDGYIPSQGRKIYKVNDRVIVLFSGYNPPRWHWKTGIIDSISVRDDQRYYVVFEDDTMEWITFRNDNMRYLVNEGEDVPEGGRRKTKKGRRKSRRKKRTKKKHRRKTKRKRKHRVKRRRRTRRR